jgi:hypothetical protein
MQTQPRLNTIDDLLEHNLTVFSIARGDDNIGDFLEKFEKKLAKNLSLNTEDDPLKGKIDDFWRDQFNYVSDSSLSVNEKNFFNAITYFKDEFIRISHNKGSNTVLDDIDSQSANLLSDLLSDDTLKGSVTKIKEQIINGETINYPEELRNLRQQFKEKIFENLETHVQFVKRLLSRVEFLKTEEGQEFGNWEDSLKNLLDENHDLFLKNADKVQPEIVNNVVKLADDMVVDSKSKALFFEKIFLPICRALNKVGLVSNETINDYESRVDKYNVQSWVNTIKSNAPAKECGVTPLTKIN